MVLLGLGALIAASFLGSLGRLFSGEARKGPARRNQEAQEAGHGRFGIAEEDVVDVTCREVNRD
jgi:hypothetical protein